MIKSKAFQLSAVALAAGVLIGAAADNALTSPELRNLTPGQANRQFQRDLLSVLRPMQKYPKGMRLVVGDAWTFTKPVATEFAPLCQRDMLAVNYEPVSRSGRYESWPVTPTGVYAERTYRFVAPPKPADIDAAERDDYFRSPLDPKCRNADKAAGPNEWEGWFTANSPADAMEAGFAVLALQEWVARKGNAFSNCLVEANGVEDCNSYAAASLGLDKLGSAVRCSSAEAGQICLELESGGTVFTIRARSSSTPMTADQIISASALQQIIVT